MASSVSLVNMYLVETVSRGQGGLSSVGVPGRVDIWVFSGGSRFFFFQAEDGIRELVRSRGLVDVYKRQSLELGR